MYCYLHVYVHVATGLPDRQLTYAYNIDHLFSIWFAVGKRLFHNWTNITVYSIRGANQVHKGLDYWGAKQVGVSSK